MANLYPNGLGGSGGSRYAKIKNLLVAGGSSPYRGDIFYVHHSGSDSNSGTEINKPFATIGKAVGTGTVSGSTTTNVVPGAAGAGSIIAVLPGHRETIRYGQNTWASAAPIPYYLKLIGMGDGEEMPYVDCEDDVCLMSTKGFQIIDGIRFGQNQPRSSAFNPSAYRIAAINTAAVFSDCIFETGDSDGDPTEESGSNLFDYLYSTVYLDVSGVEFRTCIFKNTATSHPQRVQAIRVISARTGIKLTDCMFDGGITGWGPPAFSYGRPWASSLFAVGGLMATGLTLINGADFSLESTGGQYAMVSVAASNGSSQVIS